MLDRIRVVLVRPRRGGNVGSVARAMKNMGLAELVVVAPRTTVGRVGERMAAHARDLLARRRTVASLAAAVRDADLVVAVSGRASDGTRVSTPRAIAPEVLAVAATGRVALVFGPEDHGLANADLDLCQRQVLIPTADAYPSLNLAQAVLVVAYELLLAADLGRAPRTATGRDRRRADAAQPARSSEREALIEHLAASLRAVGFLKPENPQVLRDVRSLFARSGLTQRDVKVWRGIARQVDWAAGQLTSSGGAPGPSPTRRRSR
jgi:TrmH family RNA methyltransferase